MLGKVLLYQQRLPDVYLVDGEDAARAHLEGKQVPGARLVQHAGEQAAPRVLRSKRPQLLELRGIEPVEGA